jgi:endoglucanase
MSRLLALLLALTAGLAQAEDVHAQQRRLGRGLNMGNCLEAPSEGAWGVRIREGDFANIRRAGFDSVRIPVRWSAHAGKEPPFAIDPAFASRVESVVRDALASGLAVVLNVHHYEELDKEPLAHRARLVGIWRQVSERYRGFPGELQFEVYNEPHGAHTPEIWNETLGLALAEIRRHHPVRAVHVGGVEWSQAHTLAKLRLPADDRHLIGHFHCYAPFAFTHQGAEWVSDTAKWIGRGWQGTESERAEVAKVLDTAAAWSQATGRPVYLGEFGSYGKHAEMDSRARWTRFVAREAERRGISWAYWEYQAGFGAWDPKARSWRAPLLQALLPGAGER